MNLDLPTEREARAWLDRLAAGASWRDALEQVLLELDLERAERLMQVMKEGRGTWLALALSGEERGAAWLFGNALSGTAVVLARLGLEVRLFDPLEARGRVAERRDRALCDGRARWRPFVRDADLAALARAEGGAPALAVVEGPVPGELGGSEDLVQRLARLGPRRLWRVGDNRLAYKRSTGVRADLRVQSPWRFLREALVGEGRSLGGYRRSVAVNGGSPRALALYPHRWDYSLVVGLDGGGPGLFLGPGERSNRLKMVGRRLGLFPWLTPSFAVGAPAPRTALAERWVAHVGAAAGEEPGRIEHLVATRGNNALVLTAGEDGRGRLAVHVPLGPDQERQMRRHQRFLERIARGELPALPVPAPVWSGRVDGVHVQAERRVGALNAAQLVDERTREDVVLPGCADLLTRALVAPPSPPSAAELDELVLERAESVAVRAGRAATASAVRELGRELAQRLARESFPRVLGHGDLRAKHVAVEPDGRPVALLDLGCARARDLPLADLLNLVLHDRKDDARTSLGAAWGEARRRALPEPLERALESYGAALGLSSGYADAIRAAYPLFVASSAEQFWDYSRPAWVHRQLGL